MARAHPPAVILLAVILLAPAGCDDGTAPSRDGGSDGTPADAAPDADVSCFASRTIEGEGRASPEPDGIAGRGDLEVVTDVLRAAFAAVDHPVQIAPTGGTLMDLHLLGGGDHLNELSQMAGAEQALQVGYTELRPLGVVGDAFVVEARGHVLLQPTREGGEPAVTPEPGEDLEVVTRYELRCGEPRVWIETTLTNVGAVEHRTGTAFGVMDVMLWGGKSLRPFCPVRGQGDPCAPFDVENPLAGLVQAPYVGSTGSLSGAPGTYAFFVNDEEARALIGVHGEDVSSMGWLVFGRSRLAPGESRSFGRVIVAGGRADAASAVDVALDALGRDPRLDLTVGTVTGRVVLPPGEALGEDPYGRPLVVLATPAEGPGDPLDPARWTPWTTVRVDEDGSFSARTAAGPVAWEVRARGRAPRRGEGGTLAEDGVLDLGSLEVAPASTLEVHVRDVTSGAPRPLVARLVVVGVEGTADPELGPLTGGSPAGRVALTDGEGVATLRLPAGGTYEVWATHGMGYTVARERVVVPEEGATVELEVEALDVVPEGFLSADFHVHSAASFDSSLPIPDRLLAYLAEGVDVVVATDHDVITDYGPDLAELEAALPSELRGRLATFSGVEATPSVPSAGSFPTTLGHHNAFPLLRDPGARAGGAPVDEHVDLAELYERLRGLPSPAEAPLVQMNHPRSSRYGSVWLGYLDSCGFDPTLPFDDGAPCFAAVAPGGTRPWDFDAIEVMNGTDPAAFVRDSRDWYGLLRLAPGGTLPVGTANSDSHSLVVDQAGYPVTLLRTDLPLEALDAEALVDIVREGRVAGGLAAFVWASAREAGGSETVEPDRAPLRAPSGRIVLHLRVAAAPWVPVEEVRVLVDGVVARRLGVGDLLEPEDPFGVEGVLRFEGDVDLSDHPLAADGFVTVEAGFPPPLVADLDGDGALDASDNDGDGDVDEEDLAEGLVVPGSSSEALSVLVPGARATAFTNPIFVDVDGDGAFTPSGMPLAR